MLPQAVHRRNPVLGSEIGSPCPLEEEHPVRQHEKGARRLTDKRREGVVEVIGPADLKRLKTEPQPVRRGARLLHPREMHLSASIHPGCPAHCHLLFSWYNVEHHHSGLGLLTTHDVRKKNSVLP